MEYDANYHDENLSGKTIVYKVTLKEIQEEILPELDDELAKKIVPSAFSMSSANRCLPICWTSISLTCPRA